MAQLVSEHHEIAAAVSTISLTTAVRLKRNFTYYRLKSHESETITKSEHIDLCRQLSFNSYSLLNLLISSEFERSPFLISTANRINDILEELHRKLLYQEAESSVEIIQIIDLLRKKWSNYLTPSFYDEQLIDYLNRDQPEIVRNLKCLIEKLPETISL